MRRVSAHTGLLVLAACLTFAPAGAAQDSTAAVLQRARGYYEGLDLERAVPRQFGDWRLDPSVVPLPPSPDQEAVLKDGVEGAQRAWNGAPV